MSKLGLDPAAVRSLASLLNAKADEIDAVRALLTSQLLNVWWEGPDAVSFRNDWETAHTAQLSHVSAALRDAASRAQANVAQQEQASST
jgi:uncharacterized protein YukE